MLCAIALGAIVACRDASTPPPVNATHSPADSADQYIVGMTTRLADAGVLRANVEADSAFTYENSARLDMYNVTAVFFTSTGVKDGVLTARRATYDTRTDSMQAYGNVKVVSLDGRTLTTPFLRYNKSLNEISSDSAFTATGPDRTISGIGFKSDPGMNRFEVFRNTRGSAGTVKVPGK